MNITLINTPHTGILKPKTRALAIVPIPVWAYTGPQPPVDHPLYACPNPSLVVSDSLRPPKKCPCGPLHIKAGGREYDK